MSTVSSNDIDTSAARQEIESAVQQFVLAQFPAARSRGVGPNDSLLTQGIVDSLGVLEVVTFLEKEYQFTISEDELLADHFESIAQITDLVVKKLSGEV